MKIRKKLRVGFIIESDVREAMLVVRDHVRILPSHQVDLALRAYFKENHGELLRKNGIELSYGPGR